MFIDGFKRSSKREKKAFKHSWTHLERRKSCERIYQRADGRKERKRKAAFHVAGWHQLWDDDDDGSVLFYARIRGSNPKKIGFSDVGLDFSDFLVYLHPKNLKYKHESKPKKSEIQIHNQNPIFFGFEPQNYNKDSLDYWFFFISLISRVNQ